MADDIRFNSNRPGTGRLGAFPQTGNLDPSVAEPQVQKKAKTDTLRLSSGVQGSVGLGDLAGVRDTARAVGAVQDEQKLIGDLQNRIHALVPGGVKFDTQDGAAWSAQDLGNLFEVVDAMSPLDRQALSGMSLVRGGKLEVAEGGAHAVGSQMGKDMGEAAGSAAGVARTGSNSGFKDFVLHSAETLEGIPVLRYIGKFLKNMFGQQAPERAIVLGDSGKMVSKSVWAHEIGHQVQMVNRGWNPEKIAEFAKLSGWKEDYGQGHVSEADGIDNRTGEKLLFDEQVVKAGRSDNFVSKYAKTSPVEDFAESYRIFITDPKAMMEMAPDKFLFINAQSQRYTASEVKGYAQQAGQDLETIGTDLLLHSGLKQDTLNTILTVNGLTPDRAAIRSDAAAKLNSADPLSQAWARLTFASKDPALSQAFLSDPASAMGDVWDKLKPEERAIFSDSNFMHARLGELQAGFASAKSASDATDVEVHRRGIGQFMAKLMEDKGFREALAHDPAKTLADAGLVSKLPDEVVEAFGNNPGAVKKLTSEITELLEGATAEERSKYESNLQKALVAVGHEHFVAFADALNNKNEGLAAMEIRQALEMGSVVYQGGGEPPMM